jgi:hypothetical protein
MRSLLLEHGWRISFLNARLMPHKHNGCVELTRTEPCKWPVGPAHANSKSTARLASLPLPSRMETGSVRACR